MTVNDFQAATAEAVPAETLETFHWFKCVEGCSYILLGTGALASHQEGCEHCARKPAAATVTQPEGGEEAEGRVEGGAARSMNETFLLSLLRGQCLPNHHANFDEVIVQGESLDAITAMLQTWCASQRPEGNGGNP